MCDFPEANEAGLDDLHGEMAFERVVVRLRTETLGVFGDEGTHARRGQVHGNARVRKNALGGGAGRLDDGRRHQRSFTDDQAAELLPLQCLEHGHRFALVQIQHDGIWPGCLGLPGDGCSPAPMM